MTTNKAKIIKKNLNLQHFIHSRYVPTDLFRLNRACLVKYGILVKRIGLSFLISTLLLFSSPVFSFYSSNNMPMITMMTAMMEVMARMMMGGSSMNSFSPLALAPMSGMSGMGSLPMSPTNPLASLYGGNSSAYPWGNIPRNNMLTQQGMNNSNLNSSVFNQTTPYGQQVTKDNSMNGIWQALSGDILAIYYNSNFIWTDGKNRHLVGTLAVKGNQLRAFIRTQNKVVNFQFFRENNKFAVKDSSGQIHIFTRIH